MQCSLAVVDGTKLQRVIVSFPVSCNNIKNLQRALSNQNTIKTLPVTHNLDKSIDKSYGHADVGIQ